MKKVIDNFETALLIAKVIGYPKAIDLFHHIISEQRYELNSSDVKDIYDKEYFQKISTQKEKRQINSVPINSYIDITIQFFEKLGKKDIKILDYGCGSGNFVLALASLGYKVDGIDYFEPTIKDANKKARELSLTKNCSFHCNVKDLKKNSYDYIIFSDVVEHISFKELEEIVISLNSYLTKNGKLIFHTPNGLFHESCPERLKVIDIYFFIKNFIIFNTKSENYKIQRLKSAYYDQVHINITTPTELKKHLMRYGYTNFEVSLFDPYATSLMEKLKSIGSFWMICEKKDL